MIMEYKIVEQLVQEWHKPAVIEIEKTEQSDPFLGIREGHKRGSVCPETWREEQASIWKNWHWRLRAQPHDWILAEMHMQGHFQCFIIF
jgi:hypothetical protein